MNIKDIHIRYYQTDGFTIDVNSLYHIKSLPYLSIVQALEGSYRIQIDSSDTYETGELGAFIAPANQMQYITHLLNPRSKIMKAHWIFLDVVINGCYRLDEIFSFPILLPEKYQNAVYAHICSARNAGHICDVLSPMYQIVKILLEVGVEKAAYSAEVSSIVYYMIKNLQHPLTIDDITNQLHITAPTLFRKFKRELGCTPMEYLSNLRLSRAALLLQSTSLCQNQIAELTGISDQFYLSKLFKKKYGVSPSIYRKKEQQIKKSL